MVHIFLRKNCGNYIVIGMDFESRGESRSRDCHKRPVNIARIAFKGQDLPDRIYIGGTFYKVKPYILPTRQCQNSSVDPLHAVFSVPHLAIPVQTVPQQNASVETAFKNLMFSFEAAMLTNLNQRLLPFISNMA